MEFLDYASLKFLWWAIIGFLWIGFAVTVGFDLGIAMMLRYVGRTDEERRVAINAVAPHWDGNQVWLVLAAGALFAAWPNVYATAFSGMYLAMMILLFALIGRPPAFDYRSKLEGSKWRNTWDWVLVSTGFVPPLIFGVAMGNMFLGLPFQFDDYMRSTWDGGFLDLLHPFAILSGVLAIAMFLMQGGTYLMVRSDAEVYKRAQRVVDLAATIVFILFAALGIWIFFGIDGMRIISGGEPGGVANPTLKTVEVVTGAWTDNYSKYPLMLIAPVLGFLGAAAALILSKSGKAASAFWGSSLSVIGIILTAGFSLFPFIMPSSLNPNHSFTAWDAVGSELTLTVSFWAAVVFVPIIILYTSWCYKKMWGPHTVESIKENSHSLY
ncbi:MAG: cytochrome d ubiquinol oxidase subunit II [Cocleimonas sp.]|nr:cytochrome d ubiquinol oxidase subunit II [Cocleimonas sp.]